jgi:hypothetical protein
MCGAVHSGGEGRGVEWSGKSSLFEFCLDSRCELIVCGKECGWHVEVLGGWLDDARREGEAWGGWECGRREWVVVTRDLFCYVMLWE